MTQGSEKTLLLISQLFDSDPVVGAKAVGPLGELGPAVLWHLVCSDCVSSNAVSRLHIHDIIKSMENCPREQLLTILSDDTSKAANKNIIPVCFSALDYDYDTASSLVALADPQNNSIETSRLAFLSLGYLGVKDWAKDLSNFCFFGRVPRSRATNSELKLDRYIFGKLYFSYFSALLASLCRADLRNSEHAFSLIWEMEVLIERMDEYGQYTFNPLNFYFDECAGLYSPACIDVVMQRWMSNSDERIRSAAVAIVSRISPSRVIEPIFDLARKGRSDLGVIAGNLFSPKSCRRLRSDFDFNPESQFFRWTYSLLYRFPFDWGEWESRTPEILEKNDEPAAMLLYSMAAKGDERSLPCIDRALNAINLTSTTSTTPEFFRGVAAISLSLIDPRRARLELPELLENATDIIERLFISAGLAIANHSEGGRLLHESLISSKQSSLLRPVWKQIIVEALLVSSGKKTEIIDFWGRYLNVSMDKCRRELNLTRLSKFRKLLTDQSATLEDRPTIFFSYARDDRLWLDKLIQTIEPYLPSNSIFWEDSSIKRGKWLDKILEALNSAYVVVFLVSPSMLKSEFIMETELPLAIKRAEEGEADISWILLEDCEVLNSPLSAWQGFSDRLKLVGASSSVSQLPDQQQNIILDQYAMYILNSAHLKIVEKLDF